MSHTVETATTLLKITTDTLLQILHKIKIAQSALLDAAVNNLPDVCLCPATKLVRSVRMLETHKIAIPYEITTTVPVKTLSDLPHELLRAMFNNVFEDTHEKMSIDDALEIHPNDISFSCAFKTSRHLVTDQLAFGVNIHLRSIVLYRSLGPLQGMETDCKSIAYETSITAPHSRSSSTVLSRD